MRWLSRQAETALSQIGVAPDFRFTGASEGAEIPFLHRKLADGDQRNRCAFGVKQPWPRIGAPWGLGNARWSSANGVGGTSDDLDPEFAQLPGGRRPCLSLSPSGPL